MKKSLLALAVLGSFAAVAQAQTSVTIYGIVDSSIVFQSKAGTNNNGLFSLASGMFSGSRLGFKGSEDLGGGLKANFQLETGFTQDNGALDGQDNTGSTNLFRRTSTVGLSGNFGSVNLGRQTDFAYSGPAGGMQTFSTAGYVGSFTAQNGTTQTRLQGDRTNNSIRYDMPSINGLNGGIMLGLGEQAGGGSAGQAYAAGLRYDNGPIGVGASYYQSKIGTTPADRNLSTAGFPPVAGSALANAAANGDDGTKTFTLGASYDFGVGKLYGNWSRARMATFGTGHTINTGAFGTSGNDKLDLYEIGYNHNLTSSLKLLTGYSHTKLNFVDGSSQGKLNQIYVGTDYYLSKRTDLHALATYMKSSDVANPLKIGASTGNVTGSIYALGVGIRHAF